MSVREMTRRRFRLTMIHLLVPAVDPLLAVTLHEHLHRQLVVEYLHQIGIVTTANPLANAGPVVVNLAVVEALWAGDGRREPDLLVGWLLVDDVREAIVEVQCDDSGLHGMRLVMLGKEVR